VTPTGVVEVANNLGPTLARSKSQRPPSKFHIIPYFIHNLLDQNAARLMSPQTIYSWINVLCLFKKKKLYVYGPKHRWYLWVFLPARYFQNLEGPNARSYDPSLHKVCPKWIWLLDKQYQEIQYACDIRWLAFRGPRASPHEGLYESGYFLSR
jgi:hypothetical protein